MVVVVVATTKEFFFVVKPMVWITNPVGSVSQNYDIGHTVIYWTRKVVRSYQRGLFSQHKYRPLDNLSGTIGSEVLGE